MASTLKLGGVRELAADLDGLVPALVGDTAPLQRAHADDTADTLRAAYPVVTGELRAGVRVETAPSQSPARVFAQVVSTAPHAEYYEFGTFRTAPNPAFVPITRRGRETFVAGVIGLVEAEGLTVTGKQP